MQQQVRRPPECGMQHHGVLDGVVGEDVAGEDLAVFQVEQRVGRCAGEVSPDRFTRRCQCRMRQRQTEGLPDDLTGPGGAEELAAAAGGCAGAAARLRGVLETHLAGRVAHADGLDRAVVLAVGGAQCGAAGHQDGRVVVHGRQRDHHRGQSLVAGGDAHDRAAGRQRTDQAAHHDGGVIAVGQRVEHADSALGAAVAGIGDIGGVRQCALGGHFAGGFVDQLGQLVVAGVQAQCDRVVVGIGGAAGGADDHHRIAVDVVRVPAHADIHRHTEQVAAGGVCEQLGCQGKPARWAGGLRPHLVDARIGAGEQVAQCHEELPRRRRLVDEPQPYPYPARSAHRGPGAELG